jgi:uncharacterized damage-inducible protein DinB
MAFHRPEVPRPSDDEAEVLLGFLAWKRAQVVATTEGLSEDQLRWTPAGRLLPIVGIINHLALMEWRWVEGRYLASAFPPRQADEFLVPTNRSAAEVIQSYEEQAQRTATVIRSAPTLDAPCLGEEGDRGPVHALFGFDRPVSLRWVLLHVIDDTSHHAGHADATREMLDGRRMSE